MVQRHTSLNLREVEKDERGCALIALSFASGGMRPDVVAILRNEGFFITESALDRHLLGKSRDEYLQELWAKKPGENVMDASRKIVRDYLLAKPRHNNRERVWDKFPDTRALVAALLEKNINHGYLAKLFSHYVAPGKFHNSAFANAEEEANGRLGLIKRLHAGEPPYIEPLTKAQIEKGEETAQQLLDMFDGRIGERHDWFEGDESRAFVLSLITLGATPNAVQWALKERFKIDVTPQGIEDQMGPKPDDVSLEEHRARFVALKERGIPKETYQTMRGEAQTYLQKYFDYKRERNAWGGKRSALSQKRASELPERNEYEPLNGLARAIRARADFFEDDRLNISVRISYGATPSSNGPVQTVFLRIENTGRGHAKLLDKHLRDELRDMQANFPAKIREALEVRFVQATSEIRVVFRGLGDKEDALYWFDPSTPAKA
jgi:hypothetical protein